MWTNEKATAEPTAPTPTPNRSAGAEEHPAERDLLSQTVRPDRSMRPPTVERSLADPEIFRRRGRSDTAAAAVAWSIAKANDTLGAHRGGLTTKELIGWFGVKGSVSQRAATMLRAVGAAHGVGPGELRLGTTRYLVAAHRRRLMERRDRYAAG